MSYESDLKEIRDDLLNASRGDDINLLLFEGLSLIILEIKYLRQDLERLLDK